MPIFAVAHASASSRLYPPAGYCREVVEFTQQAVAPLEGSKIERALRMPPPGRQTIKLRERRSGFGGSSGLRGCFALPSSSRIG